MRGPFTRRSDGTFDVVLGETEAAALKRIAEDLIAALDEPDEGMHRLFPPGYRDDPERDESFTAMTRDDLVEGKRRAARALGASIEAGTVRRGRWSGSIDHGTAESWLTVINDARLILGTRLGVTEEMDHRPLPDRDARAPAHNLYLYLSALEEYLVEQLFDTVVVTQDED